MAIDHEHIALMACKACRQEFTGGPTTCPVDGTPLEIVSDPLVGSTFEKYEITDLIGRGGMGVVYRARHTFIENTVAVKVLYKEFAENKQTLDRFQQEAKTVATLKHPNILTVSDYGISPQPYLVMEYVRGTALGDYLDMNGHMPVDHALRLFIQVCDGLAHAHAKGIIHRDLKPANIMISMDEHGQESVKIVDFGIAKMKPRDGVPAQNLTQAGEIFGSPLYMSPEQCQAKPLDERSDLYSFGCVMYETLTGQPPLLGTNAFETMTMHVQQEPKPIRAIANDYGIPELIDAVIMRTMNKEPNRRYKNALELKAALLDAAKRSNIHIQDNCGGYLPKLHETVQAARIAPAHAKPNADTVVSGSVQQPAPIDAERAELQRLIKEANAITQTHHAKASNMKALIVLLVCALGLLVYLVLPGPEKDPAPTWQREVWRWTMQAGDNAFDAAQSADGAQKKQLLRDAISKYQFAAELGKQMGPIYDKQIKALGSLAKAFAADGKKDESQEARTAILRLYPERFATMLESDPAGYHIVLQEAIAQLGNSDPASANEMTSNFLEKARGHLQSGNYDTALKFFDAGIQIEEQRHSNNRDLKQIATAFSHELGTGKAISSSQKKKLEELINRASACNSRID